MSKKVLLSFAMLWVGITSSTAQLKLQEDNIEEIIKAMTLEEKAILVVGTNGQDVIAGEVEENGMLGAHAKLVPGAAGTTQAIVRLGIPASVLTDGPAGVRILPTREKDSNTYYCTGFPVGTALASTWNQELVEEVGKSIGNEVLEYGCDVLLAPGMNIHRSPLCGRNFEYYSEDPFVTGKIAAAYVRGIQSQGVGTSIKHFAANSQETNRTSVDEVIGQRVLREIYLKGFEIAVKEGRPWTVMSSYNRLNGPYTQENYELLTTILRDEWGYDGIVMTDWTSPRNTAAQIKAGNDLMEPGSPVQRQEIINKVKTGELKMDDLDACVKRILKYLVKTPRFRAYKYSNKPDLKAHAAITRQSATEGMVLLKNEATTLPLSTSQKVAVFGITSYDFIAGGTGSGHVNKAYTVDMMTGLTNAGIRVSESLADLYQKYKQYRESEIKASHATGNLLLGKGALPEMAVSRNLVDIQAQETDLAIITIGRQAGEFDDRQIENDFNLSDVERNLINDVCDAFHLAGKKVVVILNMGGVIETSSWKSQPDAILMAWQPGQEGGNSVADVLIGKENPSGKLTMTFPNSISDVPSSKNYPNVGRNTINNLGYTLHAEGLNVGYRYFNSNNVGVSYPFGYGLSYTSFAYSKQTVKMDKDGFIATVTITNTGNVAGKEVAQLYVSAPSGGLEKPTKELKSFAKTRTLNPGESQVLIFRVSLYDLASYNETTQAWETAAGKYTLSFSTNVEDTKATAVINIAKSQSVAGHNVMKPSKEL